MIVKAHVNATTKFLIPNPCLNLIEILPILSPFVYKKPIINGNNTTNGETLFNIRIKNVINKIADMTKMTIFLSAFFSSGLFISSSFDFKERSKAYIEYTIKEKAKHRTKFETIPVRRKAICSLNQPEIPFIVGLFRTLNVAVNPIYNELDYAYQY